MSSANVLSIQAIEDLKAALVRFGGEAREALNAAEQEIRRTLDWLQERANHWQNEVRRREEAVRQAEAALARCQASGYYDRGGHYHAPDCSAYQNALLQARVRLREAEMELRNVQQWTQHVQQAVAEYQREAQRLARQISHEVANASALLGRKIATLQTYVAISAPVADSALPGIASTAPMTPQEVKAALTEDLPKDIKGEVLEELVTRLCLQDPDMQLIYRHKKVNSPGFDPVFFNRRTNEVIVTEMKNWGTADNPATVQFAGTKGPNAWDNLEKNIDQVRRGVGSNPTLDSRTQQQVRDALEFGNVRFVIVTGPFTHLSNEWESVLRQGDTFSHIPFEQLYKGS